MTGWGAFWNAYRRSIVDQAQIHSRRAVVNGSSQKATDTTARRTRSIATAAIPNTENVEESNEEFGWAKKELDDETYRTLMESLDSGPSQPAQRATRANTKTAKPSIPAQKTASQTATSQTEEPNDEYGWANEYDDVSFWVFSYLK